MTADDARRVALALPQTEEKPHHGFPSWRVGGKIIATLPDEDHLHVMLEPERIREAVAVAPECCEEKWWGSTLSACRIRLSRIDEDALAPLLEDAWRRRAPARLL